MSRTKHEGHFEKHEQIWCVKKKARAHLGQFYIMKLLWSSDSENAECLKSLMYVQCKQIIIKLIFREKITSHSSQYM